MYSTFNGANIHWKDDSKMSVVPVWKAIETQMFGEVDRKQTDLVIVQEGTPLTWENLSKLLPYCAPTIGELWPTGLDLPMVNVCNNNDLITLTSAVVTEMPQIVLGPEDDILGRMKFVGIIGDGMNAEDANSYYTNDTQAFAPAALDKSKIRSQEYGATWGTRAGFTSFQPQDKFTIRHELKLEPVKAQGRTRGFKVQSYVALASFMPIGPTKAQIDAQLRAQGSGATQGHRAGASTDDLVITGTSVSVTLKNAALVSDEYVFGSLSLRNGEVGFVTTVDTSDGTWTGGLVLS